MVIGLAGFTDALTILDPLLIDDHFALIFVSLRLIVCHLVLLAVRVLSDMRCEDLCDIRSCSRAIMRKIIFVGNDVLCTSCACLLRLGSPIKVDLANASPNKNCTPEFFDCSDLERLSCIGSGAARTTVPGVALLARGYTGDAPP